MSEAEKCPMRKSNSVPCGRPIKSDGLCGLHAAAKRRREAHEAHEREEYDARTRRWEAVNALSVRLTALGVEARPSYDGVRYAGVRLTTDAALALVERLERES